MASWPTTRRTIGQSTTRLDGPVKVTGLAKYTYDQNPAGLCYAVVLYAPVGRGRITRMDSAKAATMPGVKTIQVQRREGQEFRYHGDYLAIVVGETENQARDAARAIEFAYEPLQAVPDEPSAMAAGAPQVVEQGNLKPSEPQARGDVDQALAQAAAIYEGDFRVHVKLHTCLESHGAVAAWQGEQAQVWSSTQGVSGVREQVARFLSISPANVEVVCEYMGGGFGSKLGASEEGRAAALSKDIGAPVKFMLERELEQVSGGCERSAMGRIKLAADGEGRLTACEATSFGTGGVVGNADIRLPFTYRVPNVRAQHTNVSVNAGPMKAFRAPGHPVMSFIMEVAMDGLAEKLGLDPVAFRKRNLPDGSMWQQQLDLGAARIGWSTRPKTGSETGRFRRGLGCAVTSWGGRGHDSNARMVTTPTARPRSSAPPRTSAPARGPRWRWSRPRLSGSNRPTSPSTSATAATRPRVAVVAAPPSAGSAPRRGRSANRPWRPCSRRSPRGSAWRPLTSASCRAACSPKGGRPCRGSAPAGCSGRTPCRSRRTAMRR